MHNRLSEMTILNALTAKRCIIVKPVSWATPRISRKRTLSNMQRSTISLNSFRTLSTLKRSLTISACCPTAVNSPTSSLEISEPPSTAWSSSTRTRRIGLITKVKGWEPMLSASKLTPITWRVYLITRVNTQSTLTGRRNAVTTSSVRTSLSSMV